jgi:hypothetical protein
VTDVLALVTTRDFDRRRVALWSERSVRSTMRLISDSGLPASRRDQALALRAQPREDEPAFEKKTGAPMLPGGSDEPGQASTSAAARNAHVADTRPTAS